MTKVCLTCCREFSRPKDYSHAQWQSRKFCAPRCVRGPLKQLGPKTRYRRIGQKGAHRVVMERILGRQLLPSEYVHHGNEIKTDNEPDNLKVTDPVTHGRLHHLQHPLVKICPACGREFTPHKTKRRRAKFCGIVCRDSPMGRAVARAIKKALEGR